MGTGNVADDDRESLVFADESECDDAEQDDHCVMGVEYDDDEWRTPRNTSCTDVDGGGYCVHCECCCTCLSCEYGPRNGLGMTDEQRAPAVDFLAHGLK